MDRGRWDSRSPLAWPLSLDCQPGDAALSLRLPRSEPESEETLRILAPSHADIST